MPSTFRPVLVVIGPSGSGKSSVIRELQRRGIVRVHPTWTTRPRRPDETAGSPEHRFVSEAAFAELQAHGFFQDTGTLFGLPYRYGLPLLRVSHRGPLDAVMLRAPFVERFGQMVPHRLVYQIADEAERTRARLVARSVEPRDVEARLNDNYRELCAGRRVADRAFFNDGTLDALVEAVAAALHTDITAGATPREPGGDR